MKAGFIWLLHMGKAMAKRRLSQAVDLIAMKTQKKEWLEALSALQVLIFPHLISSVDNGSDHFI
jgi:hypothetical protein